MLPSDGKGALPRQVSWQRRSLWIVFAGVLAFLMLFAAARSRVAQTWRVVLEDHNSTLLRDAETSWNTWTSRAAEWETHSTTGVQAGEDQQNWVGRQWMRQKRAEGALWWDERAEQHFMSKLEKSQFPADCSQAHWVAHYDFNAGLLSTVHLFLLPLFFAMVRGHTLVPISDPKRHPAFDGCGPNFADKNMQCFFNVTSCHPKDDHSRLSQILSKQHESQRTSWEETLMEDDDFFSPGGVTVTQTWRPQTWETKVCVGSSSFSSFQEAYTIHKFRVWDSMGEHGKVGVVKDKATRKCPKNQQEDSRSRRVDMVMTALMSSWMLNRMPATVTLVADKIMARYADPLGQPLWKPPVLAIHIRQTDKFSEDPYYMEHGVFRPLEDYALHMRQLEEEYGFQWPSIFVVSDSATARREFVTILNGNNATTNLTTSTPQDKKRFIMYDWIEDDLNLQERYHDHSQVPQGLKHDMQIHFLATLYIVQKIADHAIVTYSSNVGRFIGEIMAAKHKLAFVDSQGPLVTSLDYPWFWA